MRSSTCSTLLALALIPAGCATPPPPDPKAAACLQHGRSAVPVLPPATPLAALTFHADAFAACMSANGFVFDQNSADERLLKLEERRMFDPWAGDPFAELQVKRQRLRLDPGLWRRSAG